MIGALFFLLQTPATGTTIDYSTTAIRVPALLKEVGTKFGVDLECTTQLNKDIVAVRLKNCTLADFKKELADAEYATWQQDGTAQYLNVDSDLESKAVDQFYQNRAIKLQKVLENLLKKPSHPTSNGKPSSTAGGGNAGAMSAVQSYIGDFTNRGLAEALLAVGPSNLVHFGTYKRIVFSNRPTAMQYQLPLEAEQIISQKVLTHLSPSFDFNDFDPTQQTTPKKIKSGPTVKYDLIASMNFGEPTYTLRGYDAEGNSTGQSSVAGYFGGLEDVQTTKDLAKKGTVSHPLTLPADALLISKVLNPIVGSMQNKGTKDLSDEEQAKKILANPLTKDPLTWISEAVLAAGKAESKNVIAVLPDKANAALYSLTQKLITDQILFEALETQGGVKVHSDSNWLVLQPENPPKARSQQLSRKFLQNLVTYVSTTKKPDIVALSQIASKLGSEFNFQSPVYSYLMLFRPGWATNIMMQSFDFLALYGELTGDERSSLGSGQALTLGTLSDPAQKKIAQILYSKSTKISMETKVKPKDSLLSTLMELSGQIESGTKFAVGASSEPTEICPAGLPTSGTLTGKLTQSLVYHFVAAKNAPKDLTNGINSFGASPDQVAAILALPESLTQGQLNMLQALVPGKRQSLNIRIYISKGLFLSGTIHNDIFDHSAQEVSMDQFKKDHKDLIAKFHAEFKKMGNMLMGGGAVPSQP